MSIFYQFYTFRISEVRLEPASFKNAEILDLDRDRVFTQKGLYVLVDFN